MPCAYLILGLWGWAVIRDVRLFEGRRLKFFQHFQHFRTILENNKTKDNKFILLQQDEAKCISKHEQRVIVGQRIKFKHENLVYQRS